MSAQTFRIELDAPTMALIARLEAGAQPQTVLGAIQRGMDAALPLATAKIQETRLTGKGPFAVAEHRLGIVTNRLRGSTRWTRAQIEGGAVVGSVGTNVEYAAAHEFGFHGVVTVKQHSRAVKSRDTHVKVERRSRTSGKARKATERFSSGVAIVKSHQRMMNVPARAPFGFGLVDSTPIFNRSISAEVLRTLNGRQA